MNGRRAISRGQLRNEIDGATKRNVHCPLQIRSIGLAEKCTDPAKNPVDIRAANSGRRFRAVVAALILVDGRLAHRASAASATWDGNAPIGATGDGVSWTNPDNWTTNGVVDTAPAATVPGDDLLFGNGTVGTINLQGNEIANSLTFNAGFTLDAPNSTNTLSITTGTVSVGSLTSATINSQLAGSGGLTKTGSGTLTITSSGLHYHGGTTIAAGTLVLGALQGFVPAPVTVDSAATLALVNEGYLAVEGTVTNNGDITPATGQAVISADTFNQDSGTVALNVSAGTFNDNGGMLTATVTLDLLQPTLSLGTGATNSGVFVFPISGAITSSASTPSIQSAQTVDVQAGVELSSTTNLTNAGALNLAGGSGSNSATVSVGTNTLTNTGAITASISALVSGNLANTSGSFNVDSAVTVYGSLTNSGSITVEGGKELTDGGSAFTENAGTVEVTPGGQLNLTNVPLVMTGGNIQLDAGTGASGTMWLSGLTYSGTSAIATISNGPMTPGQSSGIIMLTASNTTFDIGAGTAPVQVIISAQLDGLNITKSGAGTLELNGNNAFDATTVSQGKLILASTRAITNEPLDIDSNAVAQIAGGIGGINLSSLSISGGQFDIVNNHFTLYYGSSDPITTIAAFIRSGFNNGSWNGPGIISSAAETPTSGLHYGVGFADGADKVVAGLSSGQIEVKYTLLGDANLDGMVNGTDFSILAANFGLGTTNWDQGNFLYGPSVNGADFSALAANFGQGDSGADASVSPADQAALDAFSAANGLTADVPEPGVAMLALAGAGIYLRRRPARNFSRK